MNRRQFINRSALGLLGTFLIGCHEDKKIYLKRNQVIGCFGDSITNANGNGYVELLQKIADEKRSDFNLKFLNLGKSSETVTGLTETEHPGPRPYLFERLDGELDKAQINLALFCYGINCGIYGLPSQKLFNSYKIGVYSFLEKIRQRNIKTILLTPPPLVLDTVPIKTQRKVMNYGYLNPYPKYDDEVLREFAEIIMQIDHDTILGKIDIRTPLLNKQSACYDKDPIHPNHKGHELIAHSIMDSLSF